MKKETTNADYIEILQLLIEIAELFKEEGEPDRFTRALAKYDQ